jgi:hypothetical protein
LHVLDFAEKITTKNIHLARNVGNQTDAGASFSLALIRVAAACTSGIPGLLVQRGDLSREALAMSAWVHQENIRRFNELLQRVSDEAERDKLLGMIAEEEEKLECATSKQQARHPNGDRARKAE